MQIITHPTTMMKYLMLRGGLFHNHQAKGFISDHDLFD
jgi:hypothetical protein